LAARGGHRRGAQRRPVRAAQERACRAIMIGWIGAEAVQETVKAEQVTCGQGHHPGCASRPGQLAGTRAAVRRARAGASPDHRRRAAPRGIGLNGPPDSEPDPVQSMNRPGSGQWSSRAVRAVGCCRETSHRTFRRAGQADHAHGTPARDASQHHRSPHHNQRSTRTAAANVATAARAMSAQVIQKTGPRTNPSRSAAYFAPKRSRSHQESSRCRAASRSLGPASELTT
jgi:hypothetical protein